MYVSYITWITELNSVINVRNSYWTNILLSKKKKYWTNSLTEFILNWIIVNHIEFDHHNYIDKQYLN